LYLQDLGVGELAIKLPEPSDDRRAVPVVAQIAQAEDKFVPPEVSLKTPAREGTFSTRKSAGSRLSALPSLSNRRTPAKGPNIEQGETEMPKAKTQPAADESLFGDIGPTLPKGTETIEDIRVDIGNCTRCPLYQGRTKIVHTTGNFDADLMFVGEAPGADEDASGEPFVGRAGQLLNKIIEAIGMKREDVAIGNINRCRPPGNRQPTLPEAETCKPFLLREITVIRPKVIVVLGNTALHNLLETKVGITKLRGQFQDYFGVKVMPTFHPAYLLRDPSKKREVWEDMKKVRDYLASQT
jgi:DNA polymerase